MLADLGPWQGRIARRRCNKTEDSGFGSSSPASVLLALFWSPRGLGVWLLAWLTSFTESTWLIGEELFSQNL